MALLALLGLVRCSIYEESLARPAGPGGDEAGVGDWRDGSSSIDDSGGSFDRRESGAADIDLGQDATDAKDPPADTGSPPADVIADTRGLDALLPDAPPSDVSVGDAGTTADAPPGDMIPDAGNDGDALSPPSDAPDVAVDVADAADDADAANDTFDAGTIGPVGGVLYNIVAQHSDKCMAVLANVPLDGTDIVQWRCDGSASEVFRLQAAGVNTWNIVHESSMGCADVDNSGTLDGTNVALWHCNGTSAQTFTLAPAATAGFFTITNSNSQKCVDVSGGGTTDWSDILIYTCNGAANQAWKFVEVATDP